MNTFRSLQLLDRFSGLFEKAGVDYPIMRSILYTKLTMDKRRVPTVFSQNNPKKDKKKEGNQFLKSLWMYAIFGLLLLPFLFMGDNYLFQMSIVFAIFMFIIMTSMISDFSVVLLDMRDKPILYTKPISKKTISAAKTIHICIYLFLLSMATTFIPMIVVIFRFGFLALLLFFLVILLLNLFVLVFTALFYMTILKFFDGEKLKDMINYVQIILSVGMLVGYQLVIRSFEILNVTIVFEPAWWQFLVPPVWYGGLFELLLGGVWSPYMIGFSVLALVVPFVAFFIYVKLMPTFERSLQKLSDHGSKKQQKEGVYSRFMGFLSCRNKQELAFFRFATLMMKNERQFKLKVYPSLGFSLVIPFLFIITELQRSTIEEIASSQMYLNIYFIMLVIPAVVIMIKYSGKYKGAWIYKAMPIESSSFIYSGTLKALLTMLFLPLFCLISAGFIWIFSWSILPHLLTVFVAAWLYAAICFKLVNKSELPFSKSFDLAQQSDGIIIIILWVPIAVLVGGHFLSTILIPNPYYYLLAVIAVTYIVWKALFPNRPVAI
ncbi:hypothetical protein [Bacillus alkalicellulosilyticus]|uniref:hypothetical protein n=1 Tax=Alkalihalobacterium alkalicellulosilyticum TaxID=1912214 RepID=UPI000997594E|nr:hypothetical protein [Bacillus alkalicellulosilyticus]